MPLLDCESIETTYTTLGSILAISRADLDAKFNELRQTDVYGSGHQSPREVVASRFLAAGQTPRGFDGVCWFHVTRVRPGTDFAEGILPLGDRLDAIWDMLYGMRPIPLPRREWEQFRKSMAESDHYYAGQYCRKTSTREEWGPYGELVREAVIRSRELGHHDYLRTPEIIEDICMCFRDRYHADLLSAFSDATRGCIVKFLHPEATADALKTALYYLYVSRFGDVDSTCFDAHGMAIPHDDVLSIQFLPGEVRKNAN